MVERTLAEVEKKIAVRRHYDNFIGGEWVPPVKGQKFENVSPIDGSVVCTIARSTAEDIELALDAAHAAKDGWGRTSPADRARVLNKIADRMEEKLEYLAPVEARPLALHYQSRRSIQPMEPKPRIQRTRSTQRTKGAKSCAVAHSAASGKRAR